MNGKRSPVWAQEQQRNRAATPIQSVGRRFITFRVLGSFCCCFSLGWTDLGGRRVSFATLAPSGGVPSFWFQTRQQLRVRVRGGNYDTVKVIKTISRASANKIGNCISVARSRFIFRKQKSVPKMQTFFYCISIRNKRNLPQTSQND